MLAATPVAMHAAEPTFKSGSNVVSIFATVTDADRRLVPGLDQWDFEVIDNKTRQPLTLFAREQQPITVVTLLDTSASMTGTLRLLRHAAREFTGRLQPGDRAQIGGFNDLITFSPGFTGNRETLADAIEDLGCDGGTRLYDALLASLDQLRGVTGQRVILVFSDGEDTQSKASLKKVIERAVAQDVMVYAIGLHPQAYAANAKMGAKPGAGLKRVAGETGGGYFELGSKDDLVPTFARVAQELHSQYVLGFEPPALDGRVHKLHVRLRHAGMTARARGTYLASATVR
ncbi:MAG: VWA domain-containing protein [Vicinamibacterales bacterium]